MFFCFRRKSSHGNPDFILTFALLSRYFPFFPEIVLVLYTFSSFQNSVRTLQSPVPLCYLRNCLHSSRNSLATTYTLAGSYRETKSECFTHITLGPTVFEIITASYYQLLIVSFRLCTDICKQNSSCAEMRTC